jgi:hypothetical protein
MTSPLTRALILVAAVAGGVWAGIATTPTERPHEPATRAVRAGAASVEVPGRWRNFRSTDSGDTVIHDAPGGAIIAIGPAGDRSLVPAALRERVRGRPRPTLLAGHRAWRYDGGVTVLPTSAGVLGVACGARCTASIETVSVPGGAILVPSSDLALRLTAPATLEALDRARVDGRAELAQARTAGGRSRAAARLARAHRDAAEALRPVATSAALPDALAELAYGYAAWGRGRARARVDTAEVRLTRALAGVVGLRAVVAPPPTSRTLEPVGRNRWPAAALIAMLVALIAAGTAVGRRRHRGARRAAPPPCALPVPDPTGRWDALPVELGGGPYELSGQVNRR